MVLTVIGTRGKPFPVQEELKGRGGTLVARRKRGGDLQSQSREDGGVWKETGAKQATAQTGRVFMGRLRGDAPGRDKGTRKAGNGEWGVFPRCACVPCCSALPGMTQQ